LSCRIAVMGVLENAKKKKGGLNSSQDENKGPRGNQTRKINPGKQGVRILASHRTAHRKGVI